LGEKKKIGSFVIGEEEFCKLIKGAMCKNWASINRNAIWPFKSSKSTTC